MNMEDWMESFGEDDEEFVIEYKVEPEVTEKKGLIMKTYRVSVPEVWYRDLMVRASTKDEALEKARGPLLKDEVEMLECDYYGELDLPYLVEEVPE